MVAPALTFERWLALVDDEIDRRLYLSHADLPDVDYRALYDCGDTPAAAALFAIQNAVES